METLMEMIRHVVAFLLVASLVSNLLVGQEYRKYVTYTTGLMVMVMILVPVLSLMGKEKNWQDYLVQAGEKQKVEQMRKEIEMLGKSYEADIARQYEEQVRMDIAALCGGKPEDCTLHVEDGTIQGIVVRVASMPSSTDAVITTIALRYGVDKNNIFIVEEGKGEK